MPAAFVAGFFLVWKYLRKEETNMPKMKTHSGTKKRFSLTGTGKVAYRKNGRGHLLTSKGARRRRQLRQTGYVFKGIENTMKKLLPYA